MNDGSAGVAVVCVLVVGALALASGAGIAHGGVTGASGDEIVSQAGVEFLQNEVDPDDVLLSVELEADGDAAWRIEYRTRLETDEDERAFEEFREDLENDPEEYRREFHDRMNATADDAESATGREMAITEMTVSAERRELPREYGVVTYTFRWSNFAQVDGDELTAGDAVDGLFLDDASELRIAWPDGYALVDASPSPTETRERAVVWQGPTSFAAGEPRVTVSAADGAGGTGAPGGTDGDDAGTSDGFVSATTLLVVVVLLAVGAAAYAARRARIDVPVLGAATATGDDDAAAPGAGANPTDDGSATQASDGATADAEATDDAAAAGAGAAAATADGSDGDDAADVDADSDGETGATGGEDIDPELLSNEEQVLRLIEANGGRMKQKQVAEELDWTAAKTSQVTKRLREDDDLKGFRLGRENVLALPEEDPR